MADADLGKYREANRQTSASLSSKGCTPSCCNAISWRGRCLVLKSLCLQGKSGQGRSRRGSTAEFSCSCQGQPLKLH
ncbi:hypothetical protein OJAV_G00156100 [Oryzias javanicus]|uniref:Uncharacterized protein n=1 Tax=Oryzias javanicus TaxID=123683 RepID=A0A3S2PJ59_ORYJA|nr:hypothetical protein OJAV_G00156100 [Oryzias javanicus]